ncbi:hypothetical protein SAMN05660649_01516 [Desulfotomaculum arcticum]|uniref:Uncharacterized protein n=1 Tax=Desulfotruncus arcticus DSM 17038 TaxID=1121424 RepID=A0A1I2RF10_9FIRM|nr:DUF6544 family protein [Desulfotruncus arcticus]SFG38633.1 hypothetical protein SAMN05660649_01516 [Desulfotomaculum arcticum] [Desulfotruncus arcticus DSM 17038]
MSKIMLALLVVLVIVALLIAVSLIADFLFNQNTKKEVKDLFSDAENKDDIIQEKDLAGLPVCVQKWLENSQVIGKEKISTARLKQRAELRLKADQRWMPADVEQYFTTERPGFIWKVKVKAAPLVYFAGRDKYVEGSGHMLIKLYSLITIADGKGKEINQGTLLRYLAESVWFPTAALSSYISWEEINASSAKATMSYGGTSASGVFTFNENGEVVNFAAERYGDFDGKYRLETWLVQMKDYKEFEGYRIPTKGEVIWKLQSGNFSWYHFEITDIEYNKPVVY